MLSTRHHQVFDMASAQVRSNQFMDILMMPSSVASVGITLEPEPRVLHEETPRGLT